MTMLEQTPQISAAPQRVRSIPPQLPETISAPLEQERELRDKSGEIQKQISNANVSLLRALGSKEPSGSKEEIPSSLELLARSESLLKGHKLNPTQSKQILETSNSLRSLLEARSSTADALSKLESSFEYQRSTDQIRLYSAAYQLLSHEPKYAKWVKDFQDNNPNFKIDLPESRARLGMELVGRFQEDASNNRFDIYPSGKAPGILTLVGSAVGLVAERTNAEYLGTEPRQTIGARTIDLMKQFSDMEIGRVNRALKGASDPSERARHEEHLRNLRAPIAEIERIYSSLNAMSVRR